jgi:hypothetical protein
MTDADKDVGARNSHTLLVGMQSGTTTVESCVEVPQKTKNRPILWLHHITDGHISEGIQINIQERYLTMFIATLLIIAKVPSNDEMDKENMAYITDP